MSPADQQGAAARAFVLAAVLGMSLAFGRLSVLPALLALALLGVAAVAVSRFWALALRWVMLGEGFTAALVVAAALPGGAVLLPYLVVPALLTGLASRRPAAVVTVAGFEVVGLLLVVLPSESAPANRAALEVAAPWAVASLGMGLMAVWVAGLRGASARGDEVAYASARRLLTQLRVVARRLSSGLDPGSLAAQVLDATAQRPGDLAAVFVRTEGGLLAPLAYRGQGAPQVLVPEDPLVGRCWAASAPVHAEGPGADSATRHRAAVPLRVGSRMIGVVLTASAQSTHVASWAALMPWLDEHAVRLDAALLFDEVRSLATREERERLAREIHDGVAQELASLGYSVDDLTESETDLEQRQRLVDLRAAISGLITELRLSIFDLRSGIAPGAGLGSALSDHVRAVGSQSGLTVHLTLDEAPTRLRGEVETELLRIVQEAVTNARRHGRAHNLWVCCRVRPPHAAITVEDDGVGLGRVREDSYGLAIMRERARRIGAELSIGPRTTADRAPGTTVAITLGDPAGDDSTGSRPGGSESAPAGTAWTASMRLTA